MTEKKSAIGLIGLATMGENFARNFADKKISIAVFNRTTEKTTEFIKNFGNEYLDGEKSLKSFVTKLQSPRKIILLVKAGEAVDAVIKEILPLLNKNDILIDCGNSHYKDTLRRQNELKSKQIYLIGCGISGGEKGALIGPSLMPGGEKTAYKQIEKLLEKVAANDGNGGVCVTHIGPGPSGHFVKTVHNGIEYGIMQLIAESYDILKKIGKLSNKELAETFSKFNKTENLNSYLIEITAKIFEKKDGKGFLIYFIKDIAGQKGTGKWTTEEAHNFGVPLTTINSAVDARIISGDILSRTHGPKLSKLSNSKIKLPTKKDLIETVKDSLEISTIITYLQGFNLIRTASEEMKWNLDTSEIARIWKGGCIVRSKLLNKLQAAFYTKNEKLAKEAKKLILKPLSGEKQKNFRKLIALATNEGVPVLTFSSSLAHFDSFRNIKLPQNLIQAQRDFFGAHGFERTDKPGWFHTDWE